MSHPAWDYMLSELSRSCDPQRVDTWFRPLLPDSSSPGGVLRLVAPNQFICDFLVQHYQETFLFLARAHDPAITTISIISASTIPDSPPSPPPPPVQPTPQPAPLIPHSSLNKRFTFDSFVVGSGNEFAKSAAFAVAETPGKTKFNPLLMYGGVGLGKTHLLQAIGNYVLSLDPSASVTYITSEEFYLSFIDAIKNNDTKTFTSRFRLSDVLLVDDIQFLSGKESTQEEFFFIFNTLYQNARQIVLTSDVPPSNLHGLQDRLISRFQWGLSVDIQPPNLEMRVAILKKKAEEGSIGLSEDVLYYIAESFSSNIRELEGAIIRLLAFASITNSDISLDTVKSVLKPSEKREKSRISIDQIIEKVASFYDIPVNNFREKIRRKEVAHARQVAMYISKYVTNHSLKSIGLNFGGRDHSTVIHAVSQIEQLKNSDIQLSRHIDHIISSL